RPNDLRPGLMSPAFRWQSREHALSLPKEHPRPRSFVVRCLFTLYTNSSPYVIRRQNDGPRRALRRPQRRTEVVRSLAAGPVALRRRIHLDETQVLRARDAPLPFGRFAHGTRPQLLHRRRPRPLYVDERL